MVRAVIGRELIISTVVAPDNRGNRHLRMTTCMATLVTMYPLPDKINIKVSHHKISILLDKKDMQIKTNCLYLLLQKKYD